MTRSLAGWADARIGDGGHRLIAMPGVSKRTRRLLGPLEGLIDDG